MATERRTEVKKTWIGTSEVGELHSGHYSTHQPWHTDDEESEGQEDIYQDTMMGEEQLDQSQDPGDLLIIIVKPEEEEILSVKIKEEEILPEIIPDPGDSLELNVKTEGKIEVRIAEEDIPLQISPDEKSSQTETEEHAAFLSQKNGETGEDDFTAEATGVLTTPSPHPTVPLADLPSHPSTHSLCNTVSVPHCTAQRAKKPYSCSQCKKCFSRKSNLIRHERVHAGVIQYSCSECEKCFSQKSNLLKHERVHTGEKPFSCSECDKCFSRKANLIIHERVHTGEKPFSCSECGKGFSHKSHLVTHERVHTGIKPYSCSECGKRFPHKSHLITHKRIHTGEKPYSCSECGKCFSIKSVLVRHERRRHTV